MIAIYSALGLFKQARPLDPIKLDSKRSWIVQRLVPFGARMVVEKISCGLDQHEKNYVRVLVGDEVQHLEFCDDVSGWCDLDDFVRLQAYARSDGAGDWEKCSG